MVRHGIDPCGQIFRASILIDPRIGQAPHTQFFSLLIHSVSINLSIQTMQSLELMTSLIQEHERETPSAQIAQSGPQQLVYPAFKVPLLLPLYPQGLIMITFVVHSAFFTILLSSKDSLEAETIKQLLCLIFASFLLSFHFLVFKTLQRHNLIEFIMQSHLFGTIVTSIIGVFVLFPLTYIFVATEISCVVVSPYVRTTHFPLRLLLVQLLFLPVCLYLDGFYINEPWIILGVLWIGTIVIFWLAAGEGRHLLYPQTWTRVAILRMVLRCLPFACFLFLLVAQTLIALNVYWAQLMTKIALVFNSCSACLVVALAQYVNLIVQFYSSIELVMRLHQNKFGHDSADYALGQWRVERCVVCVKRQADVVMGRCKHYVLCRLCHYKKSDLDCPVCKKTVNEVKEIITRKSTKKGPDYLLGNNEWHLARLPW